MATRPLSAVILAAGAGTRMKSERPKPLHMLCGRPMLRYVLDTLEHVQVQRAVIVIGVGAERITKKISEDSGGLVVEFVEQEVQRGTGDAALVGLSGLDDSLDDDDILVLPGDTPLLRPETVAALVQAHQSSDSAATLLTSSVVDPTGYGRVVRGKEGRVARVVEQSDASAEELEILEVNTSIYCFRHAVLAPALRRVSPNNAQGEYYLTDAVEVLAQAGYAVQSLVAADPLETAGVNDRAQLAAAEAELRRRTNLRLMHSGVSLLDPSSTYVDSTVVLGTDVTLFPGTLLQGATVVGDGCEIGPDTRLVDCVVGAGSVVQNTVARDAEVGEGCVVGPFAALEPGEQLAAGTRTGPFYTSTTPSGPPPGG